LIESVPKLPTEGENLFQKDVQHDDGKGEKKPQSRGGRAYR